LGCISRIFGPIPLPAIPWGGCRPPATRESAATSMLFISGWPIAITSRGLLSLCSTDVIPITSTASHSTCSLPKLNRRRLHLRPPRRSRSHHPRGPPGPPERTRDFRFPHLTFASRHCDCLDLLVTYAAPRKTVAVLFHRRHR